MQNPKYVQTVLDESEIQLLKKLTNRNSIKDALRVAVLEYIRIKGGEIK